MAFLFRFYGMDDYGRNGQKWTTWTKRIVLRYEEFDDMGLSREKSDAQTMYS